MNTTTRTVKADLVFRAGKGCPLLNPPMILKPGTVACVACVKRGRGRGLDRGLILFPFPFERLSRRLGQPAVRSDLTKRMIRLQTQIKKYWMMRLNVV